MQIAALLEHVQAVLIGAHIAWIELDRLGVVGQRRVDLAERLGLTASGVTRSLLPLEKIGLVTRQSDPRDARVGYALITPTGLELVTNATTVVDNISRAMLGCPARAQLQATSDLLAHIAGIGR